MAISSTIKTYIGELKHLFKNNDLDEIYQIARSRFSGETISEITQLFLDSDISLTRILCDLRRIHDYMFFQNKELKTFFIPNNIIHIGKCAFARSALTAVKFHDNVVNIDTCAFADCADLIEVEIPSAGTHICDNAFANCPNLIIRGRPGSPTEKYAKKNGIPFVAI